MKRISIFALASACILTVAGVVAAKANNRFKVITKALYYTVKSGVGTYHTAFLGASTDIFVTSGGSATPATFKNGSATYDLYNSSEVKLFLPTTL